MMTSEALARAAAELALERIGRDVLVLDLRGSSPFTDFFVVATAGSSNHARALAETLTEALAEKGERLHHVEGLEHGQWVLLDYVDVVVHIFQGEIRQFYGLERLWGDAPQQLYSTPADGSP